MLKVLIVDDNPDIRNTLAGILKDLGYLIHLACNEGEAISAIKERAFDFALIDVRLHGDDEDDLSGLSLSMAIRSLDQRIGIIQMTGYPVRSNEITRAIQYLGAVDFIQKGPDLGEQVVGLLRTTRTNSSLQQKLHINDEIRISFSLFAGQSIYIRTYGSFVIANRTGTILRVNLARYDKRVELARNNQSTLRFQVEDIGKQLWREIITQHEEANRIFFDARGRSKILTLNFEAPREYLRLPLEFIRTTDPDDYLILRHPVSRFIADAVPDREAISPAWFAKTKTPRILLIASNTKPSIPAVDLEITVLKDYFNQLSIKPYVHFLPTEEATYRNVKSLLQNHNFDIIHYAGHGIYDPTSPEESHLLFWSEPNKQGKIIAMKASELTILLRESEARMVFLSCCFGTASANETALFDDDFLGLADAIVMAGVPTVLGYRWPVFDQKALELAEVFYKSLFDQGSPEVALWRARRELASQDRNDTAWLSPILIYQK